MRKKIKLLTIFFCLCNFAKAQVDLQNAGTMYLSSVTDTLYINGNFTNTSTAGFTNNGWLHLMQNFTNSQASMATGTGTLYLNGTAAQSITTTAGSAFYNFTINKVSGLVTTVTNAIVNNTLRLTSGKILLGNNNLTMGSSGSIIGGSTGSYVIAENTGSLFQQLDNNTTKSFPVGTSSYFIPAGIALTPGSITDNFSVRVMDKVYDHGTSGNIVAVNAVNATWVISEGFAGGSDASVSLQWPVSLEMPGFSNNFSRLADYNSGDWDYGPSDIVASGSNPYIVTRSGFNSFSLFAVSSFEALPVSWLTLAGKNINQNNYIYWSTASEKNNSYFVIEVSDNGNNFSEIGRVPANLNPLAIKEYSFVHYKVPAIVHYYRIKQVDIDGRYSYSKIIWISPDRSGTNNILVLMNPIKNNLLLSVQLNTEFSGDFIVTDATGKFVYKQKARLKTGNNLIEINSFSLRAGVYWITLTDGNTLKLTAGFVKQ